MSYLVIRNTDFTPATATRRDETTPCPILVTVTTYHSRIVRRDYGTSRYQSITGFDHFGGAVFKPVLDRINTCYGLGHLFNRFCVFMPYEVLAGL
jgi:hypothetical protein